MKSKYKLISTIITLLYLGAGCGVYVVTDWFYTTVLGMVFLPILVHYLLWRKLVSPTRTVIVFLEKSVQGTISETYLMPWTRPFYKVKLDGGEEVVTSQICAL